MAQLDKANIYYIVYWLIIFSSLGYIGFYLFLILPLVNYKKTVLVHNHQHISKNLFLIP
jgi:hypothetical protein